MSSWNGKKHFARGKTFHLWDEPFLVVVYGILNMFVGLA